MPMRTRIYAATCGLVLLGSFFLGRLSGASSPEARCNVSIPTEWGEYVGENQHGIVFKDREGTLRFVRHIPCGGLDVTPHVDLEIRRK